MARRFRVAKPRGGGGATSPRFQRCEFLKLETKESQKGQPDRKPRCDTLCRCSSVAAVARQVVFIGRVVASLHLLRLRRHAPQMWSEGYAFHKGRFALTFGKTQCSHLVKGVVLPLGARCFGAVLQSGDHQWQMSKALESFADLSPITL